jgi:hypothetical protein
MINAIEAATPVTFLSIQGTNPKTAIGCHFAIVGAKVIAIGPRAAPWLNASRVQINMVEAISAGPDPCPVFRWHGTTKRARCPGYGPMLLIPPLMERAVFDVDPIPGIVPPHGTFIERASGDRKFSKARDRER